MGRSQQDLPSRGTPGGSAEKRDGNGNLLQVRYYGDDGRAQKDVDYGHDHTGAGDPHVHDWDWTKTPPRQQPRPPKAGE